MKNKEEIEKFFEYVLDKVEDCYKNEVEMAIKDFNKETALEVPVQEQLENTSTMYFNSIDFEKIVAAAGVLIRPIDFLKKFRIVLDYDPKKHKVKLEYFKSEK